MAQCSPADAAIFVSRESINSTLAAYNNSCVEMRSEARDAYIQVEIDNPDYE